MKTASVYMIEVQDLSRYDAIVRSILYTGYTSRPIEERYKEHLNKRGSRYMRIYHPRSRKKLVYVEAVEPKLPEWKYHPREWEIKKMVAEKKRELIHSERNRLIEFKPNFGHPVIKLREV